MSTAAWFLFSVLLTLGWLPGGAEAQGTSTVCRFTSGPLAGQLRDYAPAQAVPVGTPCDDRQGSTGVVVLPPEGRGQMSTVCRFTSGPLTGQLRDYAPSPPVPVGTPCDDRQGSTGFVVIASASSQGAPPPGAPGAPAGPPVDSTHSSAIVRVFYATDRARVGDAPARYYGTGRASTLQVGFADVSVPRERRMGTIPRPAVWKLEFREDRSKHVILVDLKEVPLAQFNSALRARVEGSGEKAAFVFIHGYNVTFHDAALRTGQMAHDLGFDGAPILYSWPSQGKEAAYMVDETNVEWTIPHLEAFLKNVAAQSGATAIHVIAHSMGNRAIAGALRRLASGAARLPLREIVLTAPDIDADIFRRDIVPELRKVGGRVTLYASSNDKALKLSKKFHGYQRAGDSNPAIVVSEGLDTVDASAVDTSFVGHSYYGDNRVVLSDIFHLLRGGGPPPRFGLQPRTGPQGPYWMFRP